VLGMNGIPIVLSILVCPSMPSADDLEESRIIFVNSLLDF
jgi:hypothetical protein